MKQYLIKTENSEFNNFFEANDLKDLLLQMSDRYGLIALTRKEFKLILESKPEIDIKRILRFFGESFEDIIEIKEVLYN